METAGFLPVGGIGPSRSRFRFPATALRRRRWRRRPGIRSSHSLPRLGGVGAPLRCRQRGRGGGVPFVDPLYRSPVLAARREVSSLALCSKDGEAASVCADGRRVELQTRLFHGGVSRQWQVCIQGHWGLGRVPGRWFLSVCFISSKMVGVYCGSSQSLLAMELWLTYGWWRLASGDSRRRWNLEDSGCRGSKDWIAISLFLGTFVLLAQFLCQRICICTSPCTVSLTINTGMLAKKSYVPGKRQLSLCTESLPRGRRPFVEASHQNERASREEVPKARSAAAGAAASVLERAARDTAVAALRAAAAERAA
jgi:hypothetical protein